MSITAEVLQLLGPATVARNVLVRSATGQGIGVYGGWGRVEGCEVSGAVNAAVYVYDTGDSSWIVDNILDDRIELEGDLTLTDVHVSGNTITTPTTAGVLVNTPTIADESSGHVITGNIIRNATGDGVLIDTDVGTVLVCGNLSIGHSGSELSDSGNDTRTCGSAHTHTSSELGVLHDVMLLAPNQHGTITTPGTSGASDHGGLSGLGDDDHTQYVLADGTRVGASSQSQEFTNGVTIPINTPLVIESDTTDTWELESSTSTLDLTFDDGTPTIRMSFGEGGNSSWVIRDHAAGSDVLRFDEDDNEFIFFGSARFASSEYVQWNAGGGDNRWHLGSDGTTLKLEQVDATGPTTTTRLLFAPQDTSGDIQLNDIAGAATLLWDESDDQWEFKRSVDFEAAVTGIAHTEIEGLTADDHHTEPPHSFLLMGG